MSKKNKESVVLAIVSAMSEELDYLDEYLESKDGWEKKTEDTYTNSGLGVLIVSKVFGVGKVNAAYGTADIINDSDPDLIINVGYAGGLVDKATKGDVAIGTDYVQVDFTPFFKDNTPRIAHSPENVVLAIEKEAFKNGITAFKGRIATGDFFLHSTEQKKQILNEYSPIAFDMESAAVAQVATAKDVPFISLRTFSDLADDKATEQALANKRDRERGESVHIEHQPIELAVNIAERYVELIKRV